MQSGDKPAETTGGCRGKSGEWWDLTVMRELSKLDAGIQTVRPSGA
jgi:hypothetical protein